MSNQSSLISFNTDASRFSGYAMAAGSRLGAVDFIFENTGNIDAYIRVKAFVSPTTSPSGYSDVSPVITGIAPSGLIGTSIGPEIIVAAKGCVTRSFNLLSKRIGFFGSGIADTVNGVVVRSTTVNISSVMRNPSDLRGAQIDISASGRAGFGFDQGYNTASLTKKWGSIDATTGIVNPAGANYNEPTSS
jgi:hypothetical protein